MKKHTTKMFEKIETRDCCLQFFGAFRYDHKGPCHVYFRETAGEKELADAAIEKENLEIRTSLNYKQTRARKALQHLNELDINLRNSTRKLQHVKKHDYYRGIKSRGVWMVTDTAKAL